VFDDHLSITTPSGLLFQIHLRKTMSDQNHGVSVCALSQRSFFAISTALSVSDSLCMSAQTLPPATTCSYYSLY